MNYVNRHGYVRVLSGTMTSLLWLALLNGISPATASVSLGPGPGVSLDRREETGSVGFVGTRFGQPIDSGFSSSTPAATVARSYLTAHAELFGLATKANELEVVEQHATPKGGSAVRL